MAQHQADKIVTLMVRRLGTQEWFKASDFMQPNLGDLFVGYEASARISELCSDYPEVFETKRDGKYRLVRIKIESIIGYIDGIPHLRYSEALGAIKVPLIRELVIAGYLPARKI